ncbi:ParA family protein [Desulfatiglans anilini]|uniref:ParA family protein n=1 Tax=Desulfatiglans anilini TaxID=90728 RepID=UPI00041AE266|nr:ParA family protein [Desulfatiglans anilini]
MKKIIAVINQKGGVGKTTTSINFAAGLARQGHRVLLIDLDPQAHSTIGLGIEPGTYKLAIHDVLINKQKIGDTILKTTVQNLDLVPSHIRLDRAEQQLTPEMFKESRLNKALQNLDYDFIVIDCRPTLGTLTINALYASNFILVPCEMSRYSLDGFADLMETVEHVKNGEEIAKENFIRILLTKVDTRKSVTNEWILEQLEPYKNMLFNTKIRQNEALNQAHIAMEPIFTFKSNSSGAEDYTQLTHEFLQLCHQSETN